MNTDNFKKWVCTAIEMEEKGRKFYAEAAKQCVPGLGKDIFSMLRDDEVRHVQRIREIEKALSSGDDPEEACVLPDQPMDAGKVFKEMAARSETSKACAGTLKALNTGIDFELALVKFYEDALERAQGEIEKEFLKKMIQEEKSHYILLTDLNYYYEDPEGWSMGQDRAGLDGA
ncbi:ferritin-like domain-containing protein [Desulfonatronovibrio hydrogenovorans]|uniref:ferritin-like domain-containing protein n=1 Tax=Desulfonatronovibrio hydrogenovorans TaxID=53245 RepID=UPI00048BC872|nr:ferritin family protein [Desulfonatronovibrio hydrogenovorans]